MKKWEKVAKFGDFTLEAYKDRRRLVDSNGKVVDEYIETL